MDDIRLSVGQATTPMLTFAEDLRVYAMAGAEGIGIDAPLKIRDLAEDLARFRDSGLAATFCFPVTGTVFGGRRPRGPADPPGRIEAICAGIRDMAAFNPVGIVCGPGRYPDTPDGYATAVDGLRRAARAAADQGLPVLMEPLHPSLKAEWSSLVGFAQAAEMIRDIGEPNVGILVDTWHLCDSPGIRDQLGANMHLIGGVQVNDRRDPTRSWCDRVLPGDGTGDIARLLGTLREGGYRGWLELEVFSDDGRNGNAFPDSLWALDPEHMVRTGLDRTRAAWDGSHGQGGGQSQIRS